ncbi:hypothetical protein WOLCODRAFT_109248 [Wolfiporia cocos MD-104 SS10]|uniref:Uncharacterized protein n=1 Tax=Wolfiporia cocos (strain MD-104) TaxID=742152 RepID=A0A2H3J3M6_WOLCO|nr:hypothetical protein WOLCODRAFT_109248 [Wolfiporia cocos MD-104 SS10]
MYSHNLGLDNTGAEIPQAGSSSAPSKATIAATIVRSAPLRRRIRSYDPKDPRTVAQQAKRRARTALALSGTASASAGPSVQFDVTETYDAPSALHDKGKLVGNKISVRFPRNLARPRVRRRLTHAKVAVIDPGLMQLPLDYIQDKLAELGPSMIRVVANTRINGAYAGAANIPQRIPVRVDDISTEPPTHVFAIYERRPGAQRTRVALFPTHHIVWAANSATLPALPRSRRPVPTEVGTEIVLPVVPVRVADPSTFQSFSHYLYDKRMDLLLARLLPLAPADNLDRGEDAITAFAMAISHDCSAQALLEHIHRVRGVWLNAGAFGVYDVGLWTALDLAWEVLLHALGFATDQPLAEMESSYEMSDEEGVNLDYDSDDSQPSPQSTQQSPPSPPVSSSSTSMSL